MNPSYDDMVSAFASDEQTFAVMAAQMREKMPTVAQMMASDDAVMFQTPLPAAAVQIVLARCEALAAKMKHLTMLRGMHCAPAGDGWVLALVDTSPQPHSAEHPWRPLTRCDAGWRDEEGYIWEPRGWMPLPDPQPAATGWTQPVGEIVIERVVGGDVSWARFIAAVVMLDGSHDTTREPLIAPDLPQIRQLASEWSSQIGLPVREALGPQLRLAASGVPIVKRTDQIVMRGTTAAEAAAAARSDSATGRDQK